MCVIVEAGYGAVTSRIAEIDARLATMRPARVSASLPTGAMTAGSFGVALQGAVKAGASTAMSGGAPADLVRFGNGKVPQPALSPLSARGHRLWAPAALAFEDMRTAAARDGVTFGVTDSYRSYEQQVDLAARKGLYSQGGLAATPGRSDHGWGMSLDLDLNPRAQAWMRANAGRFQFVEDVPKEPWHWTFKPG